MRIGEIYGRAFTIYRRHIALLVPMSLVVFVISAGSSMLALEGVASGDLAPGGAIAITLVISMLGQMLYMGALSHAVHEIEQGGSPTVGQAFRQAAPFVGRLLGASILAVLGMALGLLALIVPGLYLMTIWAFIAQVIVLEKRPINGSFRRSSELVTGHGWTVFGLLILGVLISFVVGAFVGGLSTTIEDEAIGSFLVDLVTGVLTVPLTGTAVTLAYLKLRDIKEGNPETAEASTL